MSDFTASKKDHRPLHIYMNEAWYFVTVKTYQERCLFDTPDKKVLIRNKLIELAENRLIHLKAWVILSNHYHILFYLKDGQGLKKAMNLLNGSTSYLLNKYEGTPGRKVWYQYRDRCIRDESGFWRRFNYIHHNPVKHGLVKGCNEYEFSSYKYYMRTMGQESLNEILARYPVIDFTPEELDDPA